MNTTQSTMRRLILIKHSQPEIDPHKPAAEWPLSVVGRAKCAALTPQVKLYAPAQIFSSREPKAAKTAQIAAGQLGMSFQLADDLHEHDRRNVRWAEREQFEAAVKLFFDEPDRLVMGNGTADEAHTRFARAVNALVERHPAPAIAIVAHGTVITLFVSRLTGLDPFPLWQRLGLPSFVVLEETTLMTIVENVE
jgi:broad specificity phosphatase PhoE